MKAVINSSPKYANSQGQFFRHYCYYTDAIPSSNRKKVTRLKKQYKKTVVVLNITDTV
jgi:hypothetical protein